MFAKIGKDRYINLSTVAMMAVEGKILKFFANHSFIKNPSTYRAGAQLFEINSDAFPSEAEAKNWQERFVEASWSGKLEVQPDFWK
jgi:hypothetical protein